jgi:CheY-like chemotaxis protein/anti-sigma regulatory factor (Ser/Thr protein kinase)
MLAMMGRQVTQLVRLVDDLLDVSRITRGTLQLRHERVTLAHVVQGAVEAANAGIAAQGHQLVVTLPEEPVYLNADPTRVSQVFLNLLTNATKYTPPGGTIALRAVLAGDEVSVHVTDTGIGFDPALADRIFEMFVQVDESRELAQGGLGIGLTLVRQLVEMHRGRVSARSDGRGRGSEFVVRLPLMSAPETAPADRQPASHTPDATTPSRILIADDNADAAASLALLLQRDGHEVRTAHDGEEALQVASIFEPDVVLLDIGMPRMNGYETAKRLRAMPCGRTVLVAALTGWGQPQDQERSRAAGIDRHFCKPVEPAQLRELLQTHVRGAHGAGA